MPRSFRNTLAHPILRGATYLSTGYAIRLGLQALYLITLSRVLGARNIGVISASLSILYVLSPFSGIGTGNILVRDTSRDQTALGLSYSNALTTVIATSPPLILLAIFLSMVTIPGGQYSIFFMKMAIAELVFGKIVEVTAQAFQALNNLRITSALFVLVSASRLFALVMFCLLSSTIDVNSWGTWYLSATLLSSVAAFIVYIKHNELKIPSITAIASSLGAGLFYSIGSASKFTCSDIDKAMLARLTNLEVVGNYAVAYRAIGFLFLPIQALVLSANTRFFQRGSRHPPGLFQLVRGMAPPLAIYAVGAGFLASALSPLAPLILGPGFSASPPMIICLSGLPLIHGLGYLIGDALMGLDKQRDRSLLQLLAAVANIALNFMLIPKHGWIGAVIATYVSECFLLAILYLHLRRWIHLGRSGQESEFQ